MKLLKKMALLAAVFTATFAAFSCAEEEEEETTGVSMTGAVTYDIPYYVLKGETVTLSASGVVYPDDHFYKWYINGIYSDTLATNKITVKFPDSLGVFTVTCVAFSQNHYNLSNSQNVTTVDTTWNTSLSGLALPQGRIVDQRDASSYGYVTIGGLDWFSQNLGWLGAGVPYRKSPATTGMFGCYYTWREAVEQDVCPEGWRVPDNSDWESLAAALTDGPAPAFSGEWPGVGSKVSADAYFNGERMWPYSPDNAHSNSTGWNALPLGCTFVEATSFTGRDEFGYWWSASEKNPEQGYYRYLWYDSDKFPMGFSGKSDLRAAVRCVRTHPQS